jgi:hypothetical protein
MESLRIVNYPSHVDAVRGRGPDTQSDEQIVKQLNSERLRYAHTHTRTHAHTHTDAGPRPNHAHRYAATNGNRIMGCSG